MTKGRALLATSLVVALLLTGAASHSPANAIVLSEPIPDYSNPENWTDEALAAQTLFICSSGPSLWSKASSVRRGIGGIALVGRGASGKLKSQIASLKRKALHGITPVIASDEEGGDVQRLRTAIYQLPSATTMGGWSDAKVTKTARDYGKRMKALGVDIAFSPVADLNVPGFFISRARRGFSSSPVTAGKKVTAWATGLSQAGVLPVLKHWPGHGRSVDTHARPGVLPSLEKLETSDLKPFHFAISQGVTSVMVGHLIVPGLTETNTPASRSPSALTVLRNEIGPDGLIITDSLSMGGATRGLHKDIPEAAIRSLAAGVDVALVCSGPKSLISRVAAAVTSGRLPRPMMIEKAKRILDFKRNFGVIIEP
jgi:beta-N-acetylhexosaminidase